jgi:hypothetical protein
LYNGEIFVHVSYPTAPESENELAAREKVLSHKDEDE